jgi:hypothetical protein
VGRRENATERAEAIFEGRVERLDFRWTILDASQGSLVPPLRYDPGDSSYPRTMVKFQVERVYKGQLPERVLVRTGLGGGDCGARFIPRFTYLVYGYRDNEGEFSVSMCSPGGVITSETVAPDLRYLRGERSAKSDRVDGTPWIDSFGYSAEVDSDTIPLAKVKYFSIDGVLPGRYLALVAGPGPGWFFEKTEFTVSTHGKFIFLKLVHQK